jgi:hypothetical protein
LADGQRDWENRHSKDLGLRGRIKKHL